MDKFFKISERGSNVRTEIFGGLTTFFAMAYIVFVNPNQVAAEGANGWLAAEGANAAALGQVWNSVFVASILVAFIARFCTRFTQSFLTHRLAEWVLTHSSAPASFQEHTLRA